MNDENVEQKVRDVLAKKLNVDPSQIKGDTRLAEDLGLDSFGGVEIMFEIEEAFGLKISDSDFQQVRTFNDVVAYITTWKNKTGGPK
jgi:acyl carrier protein